MFIQFPCCVCNGKNTIDTINEWKSFETNNVYRKLLENCIQVNEVNFFDTFMISDAEKPFNPKEIIMYRSISLMMNQFYRDYPDKLEVPSDKVLELNNICPVLEEKLFDILKEITLFDFKNLQRVVLESLLFTGKFTAECMKIFETDRNVIFENVTEIFLNWMEQSNMDSWIKHISMIMDPFGDSGFIFYKNDKLSVAINYKSNTLMDL